MCTLSWYADDGGYHVLFNRDERRTRARARGPRRRVRAGVAYVAPVDPESRGTWLAANALGITVCLLNRYPADTLPAAGRRSRGTLVTRLADLASGEALAERLTGADLVQFQPFTIAALDGREVRLAAWDGNDLSMTTVSRAGLVDTSSAVDGARVRAARRRLFESEPTDLARLVALHGSHRPRRGSESVCMHRTDASTVSFSHVTVTDRQVLFRYVDGPPCTPLAEGSCRLSRTPSLSLG